MAKICRSCILTVLCAVFVVLQTGCAGNKDSFISGMDISNIKSEYDCGAKYFDFDGNQLFYAPREGQKGFFTFLKECGLSWVQIRTKYGMDDLETVKEMGKFATDAGLHVLIEFCYPDFQTGTVQLEEKAEELEEYIVESLTELIDYGVDASMVQISNEIVNETDKETDLENLCILVNSGCSAVRYVADTIEKEILVALHFTDISENQYGTIAAALEDNQIDYDIFTASYCPDIDGTAKDFTDIMKNIAKEYDKKVMVATTTDVYMYLSDIFFMLNP